MPDEGKMDIALSAPKPVLPEKEYLKLIGFTSFVDGLKKYRLPDANHKPSELGLICSKWVEGQPILLKALNTWKEGKHDFFRSNAPFDVLSSYIETTAEMIERKGQGQLRPQLEQAITLLDLYIGDCGELLMENCTQLIKEDNFVGSSVMKALSVAVTFSRNPDVKKRALDFLGKAIPAICVRVAPNADDRCELKYVPILLQLINHDDEIVKNKAREALNKILLSKSGKEVGLFFDPGTIVSSVRSRNLESAYLEHIKRELELYGLDSDETMERWHIGDDFPQYRRERFYSFRNISIPATLKALRSLEKKRPKIAKTLQEEFGINNIEWYPEEMLIKQYDERGNSDIPYGAVWAPAFDQRNCVSKNMPAIEELSKDVDNKYGIRFFEAKQKYGRGGVLEMLKNFHERYYKAGKGHKIDFMIILGHSITNATHLMHFGSGFDLERHYLNAKEFRDPQIGLVKEVFIPNPDIILASCWGAEQFVPAMEQGLGANVCGSYNRVGCIEKINVARESGRLRLSADFSLGYSDYDEFRNRLRDV